MSSTATILFHTKTGHSRRIAKAIGEALDITVLDAATHPVLVPADVLIIVGGIYAGKSDPKFIQYLRTIDVSVAKRVLLMTSCMSGKSFQQEVRSFLKGKGIVVVEEEFICKGSFLFFGLGHPDKKEIADAIVFAKHALD
jgi:hypothetical protein